ncbi:related to ThiJ/PfpI family protein [Rhynchosporium agropyri]|uniref:Related to ThiJ/PfpI family protein n=1 Tax=Rhynchosporium agropyri TaxID=914238 RepID=A0A1E1LNN9_9HELO|nr:related to ThiJ/PfpI family protein [Rhynchosporium agropyri]
MHFLDYLFVVLLLPGVTNSQIYNAPVPRLFGIILFPGFTSLDIFGPLDALNRLSTQYTINLTLISTTLDPVATEKFSWRKPLMNSTFGESILPTHTFDTAPELDVLIIPGGIGTNAPSPLLDPHVAFIKDRYPSLQYLITTCTGSWLAARAGVLDGKRATSNEAAWADTTMYESPEARWMAEARWVVDGNIWTSSGVSAGIDVTIAWIGNVFSEKLAVSIANLMEYTRHLDSTDDPFARLYGLTNEHNSTY